MKASNLCHLLVLCTMFLIICMSLQRIPKAPEPEYVYQNSPVRGKRARMQLPGRECRDCQEVGFWKSQYTVTYNLKCLFEKKYWQGTIQVTMFVFQFYDAAGLSAKQREEFVRKCSRHRSKHPRSKTPERK